MRRRALLATVGTVGLGGFAGCSAMLEEMSQSDPQAPELLMTVQDWISDSRYANTIPRRVAALTLKFLLQSCLVFHI